ncbi:MAG TPA: GNAT family N-acetyltransferase [Arenimonas sp.]|uniref:GNAT family N-acetyltransferase n=1 Tax=Arenimonas sp. TaxID=1872635 RepID=UPI002D7EB95C|nr:GNAT family N-acetyltransferase [Arenimonas sp.]HEU0152876.1 GNAT family N-acetyltransferase [Arenimonas sp.]
MNALPPFPARDRPVAGTPAYLLDRGFRLRAAGDADLPGLAALYADTRAEEMAGVPWPQVAKQGFLDQQFQLQHRHYVTHYADADFMVVEREGRLCGRYYLQRTPPEHLVVDISLLATFRGQGLGAAMIRATQAEAAALGCGVGLHVVRNNTGAWRLYQRLGFEDCDGGTATHQRMRWPPALS